MTPATDVNRPTPAPHPAARARAALAGWIVLLGLAFIGLLRAGEALPAPPDATRPGDTLRWLDLHGAFTAGFVLLRGIGLAIAAYLLVVTLLGVVARCSRRATLVRLADTVTVARLRRFLRATAAVGALSAPVLAAASPAPAWAAVEPTDGPPPTIRVLTTDPSTSPTTEVSRPGRLPGIDPPILRRLPAPVPADPGPEPTTPTTELPVATTAPSPTTTTSAPDPPAPAEATPSVPPASTAPAEPGVPSPSAAADGPPPVEQSSTPSPSSSAPVDQPPEAPLAPSAPEGTWRIEPGDHLWRVSEQTLLARTGRPPTEDQTEAYLRRVIAANRDLLVVPDNPDLVFAGQVFLLPPIPG